jgi:hypothetical protein
MLILSTRTKGYMVLCRVRVRAGGRSGGILWFIGSERKHNEPSGTLWSSSIYGCTCTTPKKCRYIHTFWVEKYPKGSRGMRAVEVPMETAGSKSCAPAHPNRKRGDTNLHPNRKRGDTNLHPCFTGVGSASRLWRIPRTLMLRIERFGAGGGNKLSTAVVIPPILDLRKPTSPPQGAGGSSPPRPAGQVNPQASMCPEIPKARRHFLHAKRF